MDLGLPLALIHLWTFSTSASKAPRKKRKRDGVSWPSSRGYQSKPQNPAAWKLPPSRRVVGKRHGRLNQTPKLPVQKKGLSEQPRYKSPMKPMKPCANASQARDVICHPFKWPEVLSRAVRCHRWLRTVHQSIRINKKSIHDSTSALAIWFSARIILALWKFWHTHKHTLRQVLYLPAWAGCEPESTVEIAEGLWDFEENHWRNRCNPMPWGHCAKQELSRIGEDALMNVCLACLIRFKDVECEPNTPPNKLLTCLLNRKVPETSSRPCEVPWNFSWMMKPQRNDANRLRHIKNIGKCSKSRIPCFDWRTYFPRPSLVSTIWQKRKVLYVAFEFSKKLRIYIYIT